MDLIGNALLIATTVAMIVFWWQGERHKRLNRLLMEDVRRAARQAMRLEEEVRRLQSVGEPVQEGHPEEEKIKVRGVKKITDSGDTIH